MKHFLLGLWLALLAADAALFTTLPYACKRGVSALPGSGFVAYWECVK